MKTRKVFKKNYKIVIGIIIGIIISSVGVYAATTIAGSNITYSNTKSGLSSTNIQGAIDELYEKSDAGKVINKAGKFVAAYTYNQTSGTDNYCVTGKEATCKQTTCYKTKTANSCPAGTIIFYKVNDLTIIPFHVMSDNGSTMTMQSQKNIINKTPWISKVDYIASGGTEADYGEYGNHSKGPLTILAALENATSNWSNVNDQTYSLSTNTGCSAYDSCIINSYTLGSRTAKARLMTLQETANLGCSTSEKSCPIWIYNYLNDSTSYGGTENGSSNGYGYWSSMAHSASSASAWFVHYDGHVGSSGVGLANGGARAVVEISK